MKEIIGLEIGSHSIKILVLKKTKKRLFLTHLGHRNIPEGIDHEDTKTISSILKLLAEEMGIKTKKVNLTLSGPEIQIRRMVMPSIPKKELIGAIRWEMKSFLPFPVEEATFRFHIIDQFIQDKTKKLDLLAVACPSNLIDRTISITNEAGFDVKYLDVNAFSLWNTLLFTNEIKIGETVALLDFGAKKTNLYLFKDGILQFGREFTPSGDDLTNAIMEEIPFKEDPHLLFEMAERIKEEIGIPLNSELIKKGEILIDPSRLMFVIRPLLEKWVSEINRSIEYYRIQFYGEHIDRILICGGGSGLKNLSSYLSRELRLPVSNFNPLLEIIYDPKKVDKKLIDQKGSTFSASFGVAISETKKINFLPEKASLLERVSLDKIIFTGIPILILFLYLLLIWQNENKLKRLKIEFDDKKAKLAKVESLISEMNRLKEKEKKIENDLSLFPSMTIRPIPFGEILLEINELIPANVTLTVLEIGSEIKSKMFNPSSALPKEGELKGKSILYLSGLAFGNDIQALSAISKIIDGLESSQRFKNVKLLSTSENKNYNRLSFQFEIICEIFLPIEPFKAEGLKKKGT